MGIFMNAYCYADYFKKHAVKEPLFALSVIADVIGLLLSTLGYAFLYNITKKGDNPPSMTKYLLIGLAISFVIACVSIVISYFIPKKKE